ncbi:sensor domain-containing diguanylate cyclase [Sapientia aquatica]|uniref:diguanylate cyclase n=1 Tax=Sapientia aquatica TaxID=1549640 RepID=A0A4R5W0P2_9BURK|nr:GGDEF domain-containing protein [Sapientia aquatica]TDK65601.1 diguanylate cyclase [Sapientia aquatica]
MAFKFSRLVLLMILWFGFLLSPVCHAQANANLAASELAYSCPSEGLFQNGQARDVEWRATDNGVAFVEPKSHCWIRVNLQRVQVETGSPNYLLFSRSPMLSSAFYDAQGQLIDLTKFEGSKHAPLISGRLSLFPLFSLAPGPLYIKLDSANPTFDERVMVKTPGTLEALGKAQSTTIVLTVLAATGLLTSALFTASFGIALRDIDFGIYSLYSFFIGLTLLAWDQVDAFGLGNHYGWLWQLSAPLATMMLCWLSIRFGQFNQYSVVAAIGLKLFIAFNGIMLIWALVALIGVPVGSMPFNRINYENWQDVLVGGLIMIGGLQAWRRGAKDGLLMFLSLSPSMFSDLVNRVWDPAVAPFLHSSVGITFPTQFNQLIHINGSLTWLALPLVFCFCLARRTLLLHRALIEERKLLEERVVERTQDLHLANKELELLAATDALTGLVNRRRMIEWINHEMDRCRRTKKPLALCMIDVDNFKFINDNYGHPTGDRVIAAIASVFKEVMRRTDIAARFGGEEFLLLMPETDETEALLVSERLREVIAAIPFFSDNGYPFALTVSIGVTLFDHGVAHDTISNILTRADKALYSAKHAGRNQVIFA